MKRQYNLTKRNKEGVMRKLLACLVITAIIAVSMVGCSHLSGEHPTAEHPDKAQAPKDHPAH